MGVEQIFFSRKKNVLQILTCDFLLEYGGCDLPKDKVKNKALFVQNVFRQRIRAKINDQQKDDFLRRKLLKSKNGFTQ